MSWLNLRYWNLSDDIRFSLRTLAASPGFTAVAILTLALGIGANTAIFSVADVLLFRPLLLKDLSRLVTVFDTVQGSGDTFSMAPADFADLQEQGKSLESLSALQWWSVNITGAGEPERLQGYRVSANLFDTMGGSPLFGRTFLSEEELPGRDRVVVLSQGLWERRFGADRKTLGSTIQLNGGNYEVVGIMPRDFRYPAEAELWAPLAMTAQYRASRSDFDLMAVGRLRPGVEPAEASSEIEALAQRIAQQYPETHARRGARAMRLREYVSGPETKGYLSLLMGAVAFVLLIACANVANLQFARVSARSKEIAVRTALGAGRWTVIRQLLVENLILALLGAAVSLVLARWGINLIRGGMPAEVEIYLPGWRRMGINGLALLYTLALAWTGGIVAGIAPALFGSRTDLNSVLKESGRGTSSGRARKRLKSLLVVTEIVLAIVLLVGAGLLIKGFRIIGVAAPNLEPGKILTMEMALPESKYPRARQIAAFEQGLLQQARGISGAEASGLISDLPYYTGSGTVRSFAVEGRPVPTVSEAPTALIQNASPGYLQAMRIRLVSGREFNDRDGEEAQPVGLVSETLVRRYFPNENPIGRRLQLSRVRNGLPDPTNPWITVVGIVGDIRQFEGDRFPRPTLYRPFQQAAPRTFGLVVRTSGDAKALIPAVRGAIANVDRDQPVFAIKTFEKVVDDQLVGLRYVAVLMGVFGALALVLSTVGVYSVMAYAVTERVHEIGVRMALGAKQGDVLRLVVGQGMMLTLAGLGIGLIIAYALAHVLAGLIFGVSSSDFASFASVSLVLAASAALACYIPARRAARTDPVVALRYE